MATEYEGLLLGLKLAPVDLTSLAALAGGGIDGSVRFECDCQVMVDLLNGMAL